MKVNKLNKLMFILLLSTLEKLSRHIRGEETKVDFCQQQKNLKFRGNYNISRKKKAISEHQRSKIWKKKLRNFKMNLRNFLGKKHMEISDFEKLNNCWKKLKSLETNIKKNSRNKTRKFLILKSKKSTRKSTQSLEISKFHETNVKYSVIKKNTSLECSRLQLTV